MKILESVFVFRLQKTDELRWHQRYHSHGKNQYELHYFMHGSGFFTNGEHVSKIENSTLFLTLPEQPHVIHSTDRKENPLSYYTCLFSLSNTEEDKKIKRLVEIIYKQNRFPLKIKPSYKNIFEDIFHQSAQRKKTELMKSAQYKCIALLYELNAQSQITSNKQQSKKKTVSSIHIARALDIMKRNIFGNLSLAELVLRLSLTQEHFIRVFKKEMNDTPMHYYNKLKIEAASGLLISTNIKVKEIAFALCFSNVFNFSRIFKQYTGLTPTQYRSEYLFKSQNTPHMSSVLFSNDENKKEVTINDIIKSLAFSNYYERK